MYDDVLMDFGDKRNIGAKFGQISWMEVMGRMWESLIHLKHIKCTENKQNDSILIFGLKPTATHKRNDPAAKFINIRKLYTGPTQPGS